MAKAMAKTHGVLLLYGNKWAKTFVCRLFSPTIPGLRSLRRKKAAEQQEVANKRALRRQKEEHGTAHGNAQLLW